MRFWLCLGMVGCSGGYAGEIGEWTPKPVGSWDMAACTSDLVTLLDAPVTWTGSFESESTVTLKVAGHDVEGVISGSGSFWTVDLGGPVELDNDGLAWVLGPFSGPDFTPNGLRLNFADAGAAEGDHCFAYYR